MRWRESRWGGIRECIIGHPVEVPDTMESIGPDRVIGGVIGSVRSRFSPCGGDYGVISGNAWYFYPNIEVPDVFQSASS